MLPKPLARRNIQGIFTKKILIHVILNLMDLSFRETTNKTEIESLFKSLIEKSTPIDLWQDFSGIKKINSCLPALYPGNQIYFKLLICAGESFDLDKQRPIFLTNKERTFFCQIKIASATLFEVVFSIPESIRRNELRRHPRTNYIYQQDQRCVLQQLLNPHTQKIKTHELRVLDISQTGLAMIIQTSNLGHIGPGRTLDLMAFQGKYFSSPIRAAVVYVREFKINDQPLTKFYRTGLRFEDAIPTQDWTQIT